MGGGGWMRARLVKRPCPCAICCAGWVRAGLVSDLYYHLDFDGDVVGERGHAYG